MLLPVIIRSTTKICTKIGEDMKRVLKRIIYSCSFLENSFNSLRKIKSGGYTVENNGYGRYKCDVIGKNNRIIIGKDTLLKGTEFRIRGTNNQIIIDENCTIGPNCSFWIEGNESLIHIGKKSTFTRIVHFCAQEDCVSIEVGSDCMFSNNIVVRTSDSHPIYSMEDENRINPAKNVSIGNHVWVAPNAKVMKGVDIGSGTIIGSDTIVTRSMPENVLAVGHPARVVKEKIKWTREHLF